MTEAKISELELGKMMGRLEALEKFSRAEEVFSQRRFDLLTEKLDKISYDLAALKGERKIVHWLWLVLATVAGGLSGHLFPHVGGTP